MARKLRVKFVEEYYYHLINRGNSKNTIFIHDKDKEYFIKKFRELLQDSDILIDKFCIMNSHFHILLKPSEDSNIPKFIQILCSSYSLYYNKKYGKIGHVFQGRYKAKQITTYQGLLNVRKYIQQNPVKAGYCDKPENYKWLWSKEMGSDPHRV